MKILVLGGGYCQLNMIKRLKREGHYVILVDYLQNNPGRYFADEHHVVSTFDAPSVIHVINVSKAEGIITMGTDQPVLTAAIAAENTGLPFYVDSGTAASVTNKRIMKKIFVEYGISTVNYRFIKSNFTEYDIANIKFPAVLKPLDSQGQRGIFRVADADDILRHIDETLSYSRDSEALLEEYYPNDEITINGWVHEGQAYIVSVVDRVTMDNENRIGICIAHNFPSAHLARHKEEIFSLTQQIVDAFKIENGPLYFQLLIGEEDIKVNEIAMRIGGAYEDITIPIISGIDILGMIMEYSITGTADTTRVIDYRLNDSPEFISTQMFFIKPGRIADVTPMHELLKYDFVKDGKYLIKEGSSMGGIENATARAGYIIVEGNSFDNMINNINHIFDIIKVVDEAGNNLIMKYSSYNNKYKFL